MKARAEVNGDFWCFESPERDHAQARWHPSIRSSIGQRASRDTLDTGDRAPIDWIEADASRHGFAPSADLVASRFGIMFFDDPAGAFANLRRALAAGGRGAFVAGQGRAEVEWMQKPLEWLAPVLPIPEFSDGEPGQFGLADAARTRARCWNAPGSTA